MKYIRTENGIYEIMDETENDYWSIYGDYFRKNIDIKQSDTIEELCDEFVYVDTKHNIELYKHMIRKSLCDNDMKYMKMGTEIYGAIWTNKGLIYIAKMNEKGELELI